MRALTSFFKNNITFFVAIIYAIFAVSSLFQSGLPPTHDGEYHVIRFYEFDKAFRAGSIYPVWAADLNFTYGVPLFNYVYPLSNYFASFLHIFNVSFIDAFKLNLIVATIIGAITSYALGRHKFGAWGGLLTSVVYTYAPYHFLDIYIRGSVGEVWALAFFPLPIIFIDRLIKKQNTYDLAFLSLFLSLIIFSHNILSLMYFGFILSYIFVFTLVNKRRIRAFTYSIAGLILSLFLSSVFIVPALFESKYVSGLNTFNFADHFPDIVSLLIPSWGSGYSGMSSGDQMSFQIGVVNLLIILLIIFLCAFKKVKKEKLYVFFLLFWFFFLLFLMNPASSFLWEHVPGLAYFQFPWRLLSLVIFTCAMLAGSLAGSFKSKPAFIAILIVVIFSTYGYAHAPYFFNRTDSHYTTRPNFIHGTNSIGNAFQTKWFTMQSAVPTKKAVIISGKGVIHVKDLTPQRQVYDLDMNSKGTLQFNTAYFPGWTLYSNGVKVKTENKSGVINGSLKKGKHELTLKLEDTMVRQVAKLITLVAGITVLILLGLPVLQLIYGNRNR